MVKTSPGLVAICCDPLGVLADNLGPVTDQLVPPVELHLTSLPGAHEWLPSKSRSPPRCATAVGC